MCVFDESLKMYANVYKSSAHVCEMYFENTIGNVCSAVQNLRLGCILLCSPNDDASPKSSTHTFEKCFENTFPNVRLTFQNLILGRLVDVRYSVLYFSMCDIWFCISWPENHNMHPRASTDSNHQSMCDIWCCISWPEKSQQASSIDRFEPPVDVRYLALYLLARKITTGILVHFCNNFAG